MTLQVEHHFVDVNGVKLHVVSAGTKEGVLMIFLHGFPEFWYSWKKQIEYFSSQGYRVLAPDQRGYNLSGKPKSIDSYEVDILASDVVELIHWAGCNKAIIVGHDWGGMVAWWVALKHSTKVEKLVVANFPHPTVMKKNLNSNRKQKLKSWYIFWFQLPVLPEWIFSINRSQYLIRWLKGSIRRGTCVHEDLDKYQEAWHQPDALRSMINWYRAAFRGKSRPGPDKTISVPTLIIWGEQDKFLGKEMAEQSLAYCKSARIEFLPEATHWVQLEEPERVNHLIQSFLS